MRHRLLVLSLVVALAACRQEPAPAPAPAADAPAGEAAAVTEAAPPAPALPAADAPAPGEVPRAFLCRGNEPFWALDIGAGSALLKTPDAEVALEGELKALAGGAWRFEGAPVDEGSETVGAVLSPAQCFDTMADGPALPFSAVVSFADGRQGQGCCRAEYGLDMANAPVADAAAKGKDDWSQQLPDLATAIGRCALDGGVATEAVTKAWPMNRGKIGVRLRDSGQARFDCVVDAGTGAIEGVQPVEGDGLLPGEGEPLWLPARENPPVLHCGRVERVTDGGGQLQGYLHYRAGCD